jgi:2-C-methyl-D-erythritol 4-phosphate cytidylyltransferase/2-C-methyl-D-erythritol 2,4-cyclodiphosphate synthase
MSAPRVAVMVLAAGSGERLGQTEPKAFVVLGGRTILSRALESVFAMRERPQVIVTAPAAYLPVARQIVASVPGSDDIDVTIVAGGPSRQ